MALVDNTRKGRGMPMTAGGSLTDLDLGELYAAHRLSLVRLAVLLVDDRASAEDVVQDAFAGPPGSLPELLPRFDTRRATDMFKGWQEGSTSLHMEEGPVHTHSVVKLAFDLVGTFDGHDVSVPAGVFDPQLLKTFVDLGHGVRGLVILNGVDQTWRILSFVDDRLVTVSVTPLATYVLV